MMGAKAPHQQMTSFSSTLYVQLIEITKRLIVNGNYHTLYLSVEM